MAALCRFPAFSSGVVYADSCLGQQDIVIKEKQSEAIKSIYEGKDVFTWLCSCGCLRGTENRCATSSYFTF